MTSVLKLATLRVWGCGWFLRMVTTVHLWLWFRLSSSETLKFYLSSASPMEWRKGTGLKSRKPGIWFWLYTWSNEIKCPKASVYSATKIKAIFSDYFLLRFMYFLRPFGGKHQRNSLKDRIRIYKEIIYVFLIN